MTDEEVLYLAYTGQELPKECRGFHWIGQAWTSCDNCGRPVWEHEGYAYVDREATTSFLHPVFYVEPFEPGVRERLKERWDQ